MDADPATISYILSAIASTAKIIEFGVGLKGKAKPREVESAVKAADTYGAKRFSPSSPAVVAMSHGGWSKQIVDAIKAKIDVVTARTIAIIKTDTRDDHERNKRLRDERRALCALLDQLRKFHRGELPDDLEQEWQQTCSDYVP